MEVIKAQGREMTAPRSHSLAVVGLAGALTSLGHQNKTLCPRSESSYRIEKSEMGCVWV